MEVIDKINKMALQNHFKRVNFKYHLIPIVKEAVESNSDLYEKYGSIKPYVHVISEDWLEYYPTQEKEVWSDSITLGFGVHPIGLRPVVPVKNRQKVLSEEQANLVISQSISGDVVALLYPPNSEVLSTEKKAYVIAHWNEPLNINVSKIKKIIEFTLKVNAYNKAIVFPNKKGLRLMAMVQAKDSVFSSGGSRAWVWLMYIIKSIKGVAKLYGVGTPK